MWILKLSNQKEKYFKTKKEVINSFVEHLKDLCVQDKIDSKNIINDFKKNVNNFYDNFYYYYKGQNALKNKTFIFKVTYKNN
jgi:hypothetical protein